MGKIIVIDGPEKAGKSTFIRQFAEENGWRIRKQTGPATPNWTQYVSDLQADMFSNENVIWDRGWASEAVYSDMTGRAWVDTRAMEFILGRIPMARIMVLGPGFEKQYSLRDESDMPVDPRQERAKFMQYATHMGWQSVKGDYETNYDRITHAIKLAENVHVPETFTTLWPAKFLVGHDEGIWPWALERFMHHFGYPAITDTAVVPNDYLINFFNQHPDRIKPSTIMLATDSYSYEIMLSRTIGHLPPTRIYLKNKHEGMEELWTS